MRFFSKKTKVALLAGVVLCGICIGVLRAQTADGNSPNSLPGTLGYLYGWYSAGNSWYRVQVNSSGNLLAQINSGGVTTSPTAATTTVGTASITTGGTFQQLFGVNLNRKGCRITNKATEIMYISIAGSPAISNSNILAAATATSDGGSFDCSTASAVPTSNAVYIEGATTGDTVLFMYQ